MSERLALVREPMDDRTDSEKIAEILERLTRIENTVSSFVSELKPYLEQVTPIIESIQQSPMFRMLVPQARRK